MLEDPYEYQPSRITVAPYWLVLAAIVFGLALAAALWSGKVYADTPMLYEDAQLSLRLLDAKCTHQEVLKHILEESRPLYHEAVFVWEGRPLKSCWRVMEDETVNAVDEEGDALQPRIPVRLFKRDVGA